MIIGSFLDNYKSINRIKRQIGLIAAGLASVVGFGVNEICIEQINSVLADIKKDNTHNEGRLNILENTIRYNSHALTNLYNTQENVIKIIKSSYSGLRSQLDNISEHVRELQISFACFSARLGILLENIYLINSLIVGFYQVK